MALILHPTEKGKTAERVQWIRPELVCEVAFAEWTDDEHHPLIPSRIPIHGFVYDVKTGKLVEVPEATQIGAAKG